MVAAFSLYENRRNNRISAEPVIVSLEIESPTEYRFEIINKGKGTAFFENVEYFANLKPIDRELFSGAVMEMLTKEGIQASLTTTKPGHKCVMASGETIVLGSITFKPEDAVKFRKMDKEFGVRITYKSAHGYKKIWASNDELTKIV